MLDIETGLSRTLLDLNPNGYISEKEWKMVYGADTSPGLRAVVVGDSDGCVHILVRQPPYTPDTCTVGAAGRIMWLHNAECKCMV